MDTPQDRYGKDVLASDWQAPKRGRSQPLVAELGQVLEDVGTGFCGAITQIDRDLRVITLTDRHGARRTFPMGPGFWVDGKPVTVEPPVTIRRPVKPSRTASGSIAVAPTRARVARASRILVEGRHDAELVEKVWGADLRVEGVVVEYLGGIDDLAEQLQAFSPGPKRRVGVLVDHLVPGSKETRIAQQIRTSKLGEHVLIVGHPYVDVWQAVKPESVGLKQWPDIPYAEEWKAGLCRRLGWPHRSQADIANAWQRILAQVNSYVDLEPALLGRVEELIDFVTSVEEVSGHPVGQ